MPIEHILTLVIAALGSGGLATVVMYFITRNDSVRLLFQDRIKYLCETHLSNGTISDYDYAHLFKLHEHYQKKKGGNGFLDDLMSRVKKMYEAERAGKKELPAPPEVYKERQKVLAVDDTETWCSLIRRALESAYEVTTTLNPEEVLVLLKQIDPDLLIVDNMMPELSGIELVMQIRRIPEHRRTPIIMLTGSKDGETMKQAYDAGVDELITKPFNEKALLKLARQHTD